MHGCLVAQQISWEWQIAFFFHAVSSNCKKEEEEKYTTHLSQLGGMHAPP